MSPKALLALLPALFELSDKKAREETMSLAKLLSRFVGAAPLKACLSDLRSAQLKELEDYFAANSEPAKPKRFTRSVQEAHRSAGGVVEEEEEAEMDAFNLVAPVDIMSKLTDEWFELVESKKWKDRQDQLTILANLANAPRLTPHPDLAKVYRVLKHAIAKDVNIMVATTAMECTGFLSIGLRGEFANPAKFLVPAILIRYKEKRPAALKATNDALDAIYHVRGSSFAGNALVLLTLSRLELSSVS